MKQLFDRLCIVPPALRHDGPLRSAQGPPLPFGLRRIGCEEDRTRRDGRRVKGERVPLLPSGGQDVGVAKTIAGYQCRVNVGEEIKVILVKKRRECLASDGRAGNRILRIDKKLSPGEVRRGRREQLGVCRPLHVPLCVEHLAECVEQCNRHIARRVIGIPNGLSRVRSFRLARLPLPLPTRLACTRRYDRVLSAFIVADARKLEGVDSGAHVSARGLRHALERVLVGHNVRRRVCRVVRGGHPQQRLLQRRARHRIERDARDGHVEREEALNVALAPIRRDKHKGITARLRHLAYRVLKASRLRSREHVGKVLHDNHLPAPRGCAHKDTRRRRGGWSRRRRTRHGNRGIALAPEKKVAEFLQQRHVVALLPGRPRLRRAEGRPHGVDPFDHVKVHHTRGDGQRGRLAGPWWAREK
eukprot:Opistho-1_new@92948